jgi:hypothetical protein
MAGYSSTPLPRKLGIQAGMRLATLHAPKDFAKVLGKLPAGVAASELGSAKGPYQVLVCFFTAEAAFQSALPKLEKALDPYGGLWIAWPKRASGVKTDMSEDIVRKHALPRGLVDNKVCAIDDTWSGLRLVVRVENRSPR